jgi:ubiquinone/menaquinone biosynthesis C-methylase UbiE
MMIRDYFNSKAAIWDDVIAESNTNKLEAMVDRLNITPGSRVLDVGTGTGVFIPYLLNRITGGGELTALDIAERMLGISLAKKHSENVNLVQADITFAPFISEYFDAVICYSAFPHFQDKPAALKQIFRILKTGGTLYICHTSSRDVINNIHREIPDVCNDILPDADTMRTMLKQAGFDGCYIDDLQDSYFLSTGKQ